MSIQERDKARTELVQVRNRLNELHLESDDPQIAVQVIGIHVQVLIAEALWTISSKLPLGR